MEIRESDLGPELDLEHTGIVYFNGKEIDPFELTLGSNKKLAWICKTVSKTPCGNHWKASPNDRKRGRGCPSCGNRTVHSNGRNSLAKLQPKISKEFISCLTNPELNPEIMTEKNGQLCMWKCITVSENPCGHEWPAYTKKRVNRGDGCTYCAGRVIHIDGRNSLAKLQPKIAEEFHPAKNGELDPEKLMENSNFEEVKSIWWICKVVSKKPCFHHWQASPNTRTQGHGCPSCHGTAVHSEDARNSLAKHPLFKELDPNKNKGIDFSKIRPSLNRDFWWLCDKCGNSYQQKANNRVSGHQGCPDCSPVGFQNTKPGYYYVHEITDNEDNFLFYKAGISNDWKRRIKQLERGLAGQMKINHLEHVLYPLGRDARVIERRMLQIAELEKWKVEAHDFDGGTELFSKNPIKIGQKMKLITN